MDKIMYPQLQETIYYEKLDNGLQVYVLPKPGFSKTYATFTTHYGSIDNHFQVEGQSKQQVPDGIAHFLEHKMFEEPEGDIFSVFASHGASANAFTSFDRTCYLFSATDHIYENIETLLNFVQKPYLTDENVEKEKGIIGQEIKMYEDNPDWRVYFGLIDAMYQVHPIRIDIAGTINSISQISKETLLECYHTFYHPSNMLFFVVGGVEPDQVIELIRTNQAGKTFGPSREIHRFFEQEPIAVKEAKKIITLPVSLPKCYFGIKEKASGLTGKDLLKREVCTKVMLDLLFSPSSSLYQQLYDEDLISDSFGSEYNCTSDYGFTVIGGDTKDPDQLVSKVKEAVNQVITHGIELEHFERSKKKKIGGFLRMWNSPEAIANEFTRYRFRDSDMFDIKEAYEQLTLDDVKQRMKDHFNWEQLAISIVRSP